jgi:hypothetical protein
MLTPAQFLTHCADNGLTIERAGDGVITLCKHFAPGDKAAYTKAETDCSILYSVPAVKSQSSVWGTDGGSVGGYVGLTGGYMRLNKSAPKARWIAELNKLRNGMVMA